MYCENCGNQIKEGAGFCESCGRPVNKEQPRQSSADPALPPGLTREADGSISWIYSGSGSKNKMKFWLTETQIIYVFLKSEKKGSFLKELLLDVTDMIVMDSDSYAGGMLPSEVLTVPDGALSRNFDGMKWIKVDRKRDRIKINSSNAIAEIYASPEQFDFVLNYIVSRSPRAKIK